MGLLRVYACTLHTVGKGLNTKNSIIYPQKKLVLAQRNLAPQSTSILSDMGSFLYCKKADEMHVV